MTLKEFMEKWKNTPVDWDGVYPNQCMDLLHAYVYDVLELKDATILAAPNAKSVYENFRWGMYFDRIDNTPHAVPEEGDIIFWGGGEWGHVAIFLEGNVNDFISFDANYPIGTLPHEQYHTYFEVLGWLRIKDSGLDQLSILQKEIDALETNLEASKGIEIKLMEKINEMDKKKVIFEKKYAKEVKLLTDQREEYQKNDAEFRKTVQDVFDENNEAIEDLEKRVLNLQKPERSKDMNRITKLWENLPKTLKVFCFLALSTILSELVIELGGLEQTFLIRTLAQIINLGLVGVEESVPAIKSRLKK